MYNLTEGWTTQRRNSIGVIYIIERRGDDASRSVMSGKKPPPMALHDVRHHDIPVARHDA